MLSVDGDADAAVKAEVQLDGMGSDYWCRCLPIRTYHWQCEGDCTAVVCEVGCMEVRP